MVKVMIKHVETGQVCQTVASVTKSADAPLLLSLDTMQKLGLTAGSTKHISAGAAEGEAVRSNRPRVEPARLNDEPHFFSGGAGLAKGKGAAKKVRISSAVVTTAEPMALVDSDQLSRSEAVAAS